MENIPPHQPTAARPRRPGRDRRARLVRPDARPRRGRHRGGAGGGPLRPRPLRLPPRPTRSASTYQISNTNGDPEGRKAVGILLAGAKHFRISGPGASIVYRGKMIEVCIDGCEDITISGLQFDYHRPTVSEFRVAAVGRRLRRSRRSTRTRPTRSRTGSITWQGEGWSYTDRPGAGTRPGHRRASTAGAIRSRAWRSRRSSRSWSAPAASTT